MSLSIVDPRILQAIANNIHFAAGNPPSQIYNYPCCKKLLGPDIQILINTWQRLNIESANLENDENNLVDEKRIKLQFDRPVDPYQFLKWLIYLRDNIDFTGICRSHPGGRYFGDNDDAATMIFLKNLTKEAMTAIIQSLPQYEAAKYNTY